MLPDKANMKQQLTINDLKHYLPYSLKLMVGIKNAEKANVSYMSTKRIAFCFINGMCEVYKCSWNKTKGRVKPLLLPLSELKKEIINGVNGNPTYIEFLRSREGKEMCLWGASACTGNLFNTYPNLDYKTAEYLFKWHFDVFGLIDKGLALNKLDYETR